ncbi:hypothetical protein RhiXN_08045 [Rhizoctonia solani]|uniref:Uncharacterized protein n=1 Tax=Rhizoctonia solani TaxID=456999 RepID=A0A8H8SYY9_9AGAM|nr:uncharacterized protein RhiXN_08045 [Rhizoctonia solani]QRW23009.1 hypothetical protein RhiXN_08045 [Rhizoctonia solani]
MVLTRSQAKAAREAELKSRASVVSHASFQAPAVLPVPDLKQNEPTACWVDASSTRIAVLIGKDYITFLSRKLLALVLIARGQIGTVKVRSDSSTALRAIGGNKIRVQEIMDSTQRLKAVVNGSGLMLKGVKVPTKGNLADPFTRGKKIEGYQKMKDTVIIPEALVSFIVAE